MRPWLIQRLSTPYPDLAGLWLRRYEELGFWTGYRFEERRFTLVAVRPRWRWLIRLASWWWQLPRRAQR